MSHVSRRFVTALALATLLPASQLRASDTTDEDQPAAVVAGSKEAPAKKVKVALLKIGGSFAEDPKPSNPFGPTQRNFRAELARIRAMAADPALAGVELKVVSLPDFARTLDLMRELRGLKTAGKKISAYFESLDQRALMVGSIADVLAVPPSGQVVLEGIAGEVMYYKDMLDLIDVRAEVIHIGEFKTAYENFAKDRMSDANRTVISLFMDEFYQQMLNTIAENRGVSRATVDGGYEKLFLEAKEAKDVGLISHVAYRDGYEALREDLFGGEIDLDDSYGEMSKEELEKMLENPLAMFSMLPKLLNPPKQKLPAAPRIAIVYASGPIASGKSQAGFDGTVSQMGSDTIVKALNQAADDDWVKAVVLRVNSPGGSALASDMIWRATQRVREKKPIISSMGGVAASGGYWISMGCDRIIAQPSTLTGSIGVVGMLPDVSRTVRKIGINVEVIGKGPHVEDLSLMRNGPSEFLKTKIRESMESVYGEFIRKVSDGRHMNPGIVDSLARGRVWTGRQAEELNLVDQLGGLEDAIALACELGGGLDPATVTVAEYPAAPSLMDTIEQAMEGMVTVDGRVKSMLVDAGYGDIVQLVEVLVAGLERPFGPDRIQAVLPFGFRVR